MPLNTSSFLVSQGWEGVGVPLDGKSGKGLKKPLAIPQKRTLSGIGKDRDRANEWWNSIFTAGAKNLSIGPSKESKASSPSTSGTSTPLAAIATIDDSAAAESAEPTSKTLKTGWSMGPRSVVMSLSSLAKREHAKKTLMSNFVRGEVIASKEPSPEPMQIKILRVTESVGASDVEVEAVLPIKTLASDGSSKKIRQDKEEKRIAKEKRKREREANTRSLEVPNSCIENADREESKVKKSKKDKKARTDKSSSRKRSTDDDITIKKKKTKESKESKENAANEVASVGVGNTIASERELSTDSIAPIAKVGDDLSRSEKEKKKVKIRSAAVSDSSTKKDKTSKKARAEDSANPGTKKAKKLKKGRLEEGAELASHKDNIEERIDDVGISKKRKRDRSEPKTDKKKKSAKSVV